MRMVRISLVMVSAVLLANAGSIVVPNANATTEGANDINGPFSGSAITFQFQLAASQFGILEPPQPDERAVTVLPEKNDLAATVTTIVGMVAACAPGGEHEAQA